MSLIQRLHGRRAPQVILHHLTDCASFTLNAEFCPADNSLAIVDRSGRAGLYVGDVEKWVNGFGYWRPFVVELRVDPAALVSGRWGGESFIPARDFDKVTVLRVIPLDAYAREHYGEHGWVESRLGREFDTGKPIKERGWNQPYTYPFEGWRYPGPDVRDMPETEVRRLRQDLLAAFPEVDSAVCAT